MDSRHLLVNKEVARTAAGLIAIGIALAVGLAAAVTDASRQRPAASAGAELQPVGDLPAIDDSLAAVDQQAAPPAPPPTAAALRPMPVDADQYPHAYLGQPGVLG